jgi:cytochrome c oxidase subunit 3
LQRVDTKSFSKITMKLFEGLNFKKAKATRFHKFFIFSTPQFGPFSVALSLYLFVLTILAVLHGGIFDATMSLVFPGLAFYSLLSVMAAWFSSLINESRGFTEPIRRGLRIGMILFIASEVMFFFAFFLGFFPC